MTVNVCKSTDDSFISAVFIKPHFTYLAFGGKMNQKVEIYGQLFKKTTFAINFANVFTFQRSCDIISVVKL